MNVQEHFEQLGGIERRVLVDDILEEDTQSDGEHEDEIEDVAQAAADDHADLVASLAAAGDGFRQEYDVRNTVDEGVSALRKFVHLMPLHFLGFSLNPASGGYVYIGDMKFFDQHILKTPNGWRTNMTGNYYLFHAMSPDFLSIRTGISWILECDGFSLSNMDYTTARRLCTDIYSFYPVVVQQLKYYHCSIFFNILLSSTKAFLPKSVKSKFRVGCVFPSGRLDGLCLVPDLQTAMERIIQQMQEGVRRRYAMEAAFRL
ncbi:expressed unknown protein [Seminavis robusta]|uniref:CRAL-TRIO domain-containing protein n=1 Tax=Seminavis robusta TaxID=568900 RepID=A0A9N8HD11_9STRA|nr:expressed unknown protein [Seminavis robusta]|eukprot:Sro241_g096360.1 n/a (260) ;mRNA; f:45361-46308